MNVSNSPGIGTQTFYELWQVTGAEHANVNDIQTQVIITSRREFTDFDPRTVRTVTPLSCGNLVKYKDKDWLVISEVSADRDNIYRALIRLCNHTISVQTGMESVLIGYDHLGRPVYETIPSYSDFPCIVDGAGFQIDSNQVINLSRDEIRITMQHNDNTDTFTLNQELDVMSATYTIRAVDRSRVGIVTFTAKLKI